MAPPRIFEAADSSDLDERGLVNFSWFQVPIKLYVSFVSGSLFFEFVDDVYDCYRPGSFTVEKTSEKYLTAQKILLFIIYLCILIRVILDFVQNCRVKQMWKILVHSVVCLPVPQLEFIYLYLSKIAISCEFVVFLFVTKWLIGKKEKIGGFFLNFKQPLL